MKIDIYQSARGVKKYLAVPSGTNMTSKLFPDDLDPELHELSPFRSSEDFQITDHRIAVDAADVIRQIEANGFATFSAKITVTVQTQGRREIGGGGI